MTAKAWQCARCKGTVPGDDFCPNCGSNESVEMKKAWDEAELIGEDFSSAAITAIVQRMLEELNAKSDT